MNLLRATVLLALVVLAGCVAPDLPRDPNDLGQGGQTPRNIRWYAPAGLDVRGALSIVDNYATDTRVAVVIVPKRFHADERWGVENGTYDGLTVAPNWIFLAFDRLTPALVRHEYHHVDLWKATGSADPKHLDPTWPAFKVGG